MSINGALRSCDDVNDDNIGLFSTSNYVIETIEIRGENNTIHTGYLHARGVQCNIRRVSGGYSGYS